MKYIKQFCIILLVSFAGELLRYLIPLPIPASVYGLVLMLLCLCFRIIPLAAVRDTGRFLLEIMPLMFIPAAVQLLELGGALSGVLLPFSVILAVTTVLVMAVSGLVTQGVIRLQGRRLRARGEAEDKAESETEGREEA